jgi:hypothetical protein
MRIKRGEILASVTPPIDFKATNFYSYEFLEGNVFSEAMQSGSTSRLLTWAENNLWSKKKTLDDNEFNELCSEFYFQKTCKRLQDFFLNTGIQDQQQTINGVDVPKVATLLEKSRSVLVLNGVQSSFHGDFILDNLIQTKKGIRAIDWRSDFAGNLETGDLYYDLAKLNHSFHVNHKAIINNLFDIEYHVKSQSRVSVDIYRSQNLVSAERELFSFVHSRGYSERRIRLITAVVWLNMSALHHHPFDKFLFYFGKLKLNEALGVEGQ